MQINLLNDQGQVIKYLSAGTGYEQVLKVAQSCADKFQEVVRAFDGDTKIATLRPLDK